MTPQVKLYFGILSISFFPIASYFLSREIHPLMAAFLLFVMVSSLSLPAALKDIGREVGGLSWGKTIFYLKRVLTFRVWVILLLISCFTIIGNFLVIFALSHNFSPSVTQAILRSETIFVSLGGVFIFREVYPRTLPVVILLILLALMVMGQEVFFQRGWDWQDIYILHIVVAAFCYASFQLISKFIIYDLSLYLLNGVRSLMNCLLLFPFVYPYFTEITPKVLFFAFLAALVGPFLGRNIILGSTRVLPLNYIGCNLSLAPLFSLAFQWLFLHNLPNNYELIGGGILVLAVLIFNLSEHPHKTPPRISDTDNPPIDR